MPQEYGPRGLPATFSCLFWHLFWKSLSLLQGRLQTYPTSLAGNSSVKQNGVEGICSVLLAASHCCDVLHADSVLSSAERVGWPACLCQGACNLCASGEERRGTLPAALPKGVLAAEQAGRTQHWTHSRAS